MAELGFRHTIGKLSSSTIRVQRPMHQEGSSAGYESAQRGHCGTRLVIEPTSISVPTVCVSSCAQTWQLYTCEYLCMHVNL